MKNLKKRWLPFLLSMAMILSTLSMPARAEDGSIELPSFSAEQTEVTG